MKTIVTTFTSVFIFMTFATATLAAPGPSWQLSAQQWKVDGSFNYDLHYEDSSQLLSKVSLPQKQQMTLFGLQYNFGNGKNFIRGQYGQTGLGNKGRGYDKDWTIPGLDILTDYGDMTAYGRQKVLSVDIGRTLVENERFSSAVFAGWGRQDTSNELNDVVYHLSDGIPVGNLTQPDDGSYLNGKLSGPRIGIDNTIRFNSKLAMSAGVSVAYLSAKAYGHWANHTPAWDWIDTGNTLGVEMNAGLTYAINPNFTAELGYSDQYAKATGCNETLNGSSIPEKVDLEFAQHGFRLGMNYRF